MNYKILLVEDDDQICEIIEDSFTAKSEGGMKVQCVENGERGLETALFEEFDLILLDIMLPGMDGFSIMRQIRRQKDVPVIFLTARAGEADVLRGYELGADDYITKPFSTAALYAKVLALINRDKGTVLSHNVSCGKITIDTRALLVYADGKEVTLPPLEYQMLLYLMENKGWVVDREQLIRKVWGSRFYGGTRVVDNHIKNMRSLLGEAGSQIKTVVSKGYKLSE